jgi:hypothetical protein
MLWHPHGFSTFINLDTRKNVDIEMKECGCVKGIGFMIEKEGSIYPKH